MKNYYEILEVDVHASKEIIDKAFKVLAKKYHPDTQQDDKKEWAEEQFKLLNEAYEILSDDEKRKIYTKELEFDKNSQLNALLLKNADLEVKIETLEAELNQLRTSSKETNANTYHQNQSFNNKIYYTDNTTQYTYPEDIYQEQPTYYESYYHPIKSKFKNLIAFFITICIIVFVGFLLWKIPYTNSLLVKIYEENSVIKSIIGLFYK